MRQLARVTFCSDACDAQVCSHLEMMNYRGRFGSSARAEEQFFTHPLAPGGVRQTSHVCTLARVFVVLWTCGSGARVSLG